MIMEKRSRSKSPVYARKRCASTTSVSSSTSSKNTNLNDISDNTRDFDWRSSSSKHSSRIRSFSPDSSSTSSLQVSDTDNPLSPSHSLVQDETSACTPPSVATYSGTVTPGPLTPSFHHGPSHNSTVITPCVASSFQYPTPTFLTNDAPADIFPILKTADVFIKTELVTPPKQWQLHSHILARFSPWFAKSLSNMATTAIEATWASYTIEKIDGKVLLVQQEPTGESPIIPDSSSDALVNIAAEIKKEEVESNSSFGTTPDYAATIDIYDQIFRACYNIPLQFPVTNITASLIHSEHLTRITSDFACLETLPNLISQINATLLHHRHTLLRAIKDDPARWLLLSLSIKNDTIYTESLIHISGAHPCWPWPTPGSSLPERTLQLITAKSHELNRRCLDVERNLLLPTIHVGHGTTNHPVSPLANSEFDTWFVVSTFRSILAQELSALDDNRRKPLLRGTMFRKIRKGDGYMPYEDMRRMMEQVMPSAVQNLTEDLAMLKREASIYVRYLARNECLLDVEGQKVGWLTCVRVGEEDIPWRAGGGGEGVCGRGS